MSVPMMVHLRLVVVPDLSQQVLGLLERLPTVTNVARVAGAARKPAGDLILCDIPREAVSMICSDLRRIGVDVDGSIAMDAVDTEIGNVATDAERAAPGSSGDAVVWEDVEAKTAESSELTPSFAIFMIMAMLIAAVGIAHDNPILIVGSMIVGPEYGPIAALCVALVSRRRDLAGRSLTALAIGFPLGMTVTMAAAFLFRSAGLFPGRLPVDEGSIGSLISQPDFLSVFVALCAGVIGSLSLTASKSSILVGVLVSITTIPAAAGIGMSVAYGDWSTWIGSQIQLSVNVAAIVAAGLSTLLVQRAIYHRRREAHQRSVGFAERPGRPIGSGRRK